MYSCDSVGTVITWRVTLPSSMNLIAHTGAAGEQDYQNSSSGGGLQFLPERIFTDPEINVSLVVKSHERSENSYLGLVDFFCFFFRKVKIL